MFVLPTGVCALVCLPSLQWEVSSFLYSEANKAMPKRVAYENPYTTHIMFYC